MASWMMAVRRPSRADPRATRWSVVGRNPVPKYIWRRVRTSLTGRPTWRAASAAMVTWGQVRRDEPKAPPTNGEITRTFSADRPNTAAISSAVLWTHWVLSHRVRRSPSQAATVA